MPTLFPDMTKIEHCQYYRNMDIVFRGHKNYQPQHDRLCPLHAPALLRK